MNPTFGHTFTHLDCKQRNKLPRIPVVSKIHRPRLEQLNTKIHLVEEFKNNPKMHASVKLDRILLQPDFREFILVTLKILLVVVRVKSTSCLKTSLDNPSVVQVR